MKAKPKCHSFDRAADCAVVWTRDGDLKVVEAPFLRGQNPFIVGRKQTFANALKAADLITEAFFAKVGAVYQQQFECLAPKAREQVEFPVVRFTVRVRGEVDLKAGLLVKAKAEAAGRYLGLDGKTRRAKVSKAYRNLPAQLHPAVTIAKTPDCFVGNWEIEGHPDPNCKFGWTGCGCRGGACCTHIVRDLFGVCWTEKCAWGWLWLACGCHRDKRVPCPDCDDYGITA